MKKVLFLVFLLLTSPVLAQEDHSPTNMNHQYDSDCCGGNDCHPTDCSLFGNEGPYVTYGRLYFSGTQIRESKDKDCHVCINPNNNQPLCVYLRSGS